MTAIAPSPKKKGGPQSGVYSERTIAIIAEMQRRWPCQEIPMGGQTELAEKYGLTHQRIAQIAKRAGFGLWRKQDHPHIVLCPCGAPAFRMGPCRECRWVSLPCVNCETPVRRRATDLVWHNGKERPTPNGRGATYTGRVFCNRRCFGSWFGKTYGVNGTERAS